MSDIDLQDDRKEPWSVIAWVPDQAVGRDELIVKIKELQALAMAEREMVLGLTAELSTARAKLELVEKTPAGRAFRRIDKLEEQREQLLHRLRLGRFGEELDDEIAALKSSATWRAGRILVGPISALKTLLRRK